MKFLWLPLPGFYQRKKSVGVAIYQKSAKNEHEYTQKSVLAKLWGLLFPGFYKRKKTRMGGNLPKKPRRKAQFVIMRVVTE